MATKSFEEFADTSGDLPVRGYLHGGAGSRADCLILTHGAGANCQSLLLTTIADAFCSAGLNVLRCDLPFRQAQPHGPPRGNAERDQAGLRSAVASMRHRSSGKVFLGGHSYGGRQASMLAASEPGTVEALLLLSYPLHPPQRPDQMRTKHLPNLETPPLFVHGARDGFGTIEEIEAAMKLIPARTDLLSVAGVGHELMTKRNGAELSKNVVERFLSFATQVTV
jgi:predicted alpha/beta-hydrolase family hydrolase